MLLMIRNDTSLIIQFAQSISVHHTSIYLYCIHLKNETNRIAIDIIKFKQIYGALFDTTKNRENTIMLEVEKYILGITKDSKCKSELFLKELVASNKRSAA